MLGYSNFNRALWGNPTHDGGACFLKNIVLEKFFSISRSPVVMTVLLGD